MEIGHYVNSPAERSNREEQRENLHSGGSKIYMLVGVSFGLLCIIQFALNLSYRLQAVGCSNRSDNVSTSNFTMMSADDIRALILERDRLLQEKNQLVQEKDQLVQEKNQLLQEKDRLVQEKNQLVQEKDQLVQEKKQLVQEKDQLVQEKNQLLQEKDRLVQEKNQLVQEKDQLVQEKKQLVQEKDQLVQEKNQLLQEKDRLVQEKNQLVQEKDRLVQEKDQLVQEKKQLVQERDRLVQEKKKMFQDKDQLVHEKNQLVHEKNQLLQEKNQLLQEQNTPSCPQGWWRYMSSCYKLSSRRDTWEYAKRDCVRKGAHLVIMNDEVEEKVVRIIGNGVRMWMGLSGQQEYGYWTWTLVDGSSLLYINWNDHAYFGNNYRYQCAYVDEDPLCQGTWFMDICQEHHYWMCEMELHTSSSHRQTYM
ncbi:WD repeat-containing protein 87-like isoform X2 [Siniperca chuatsi]|uniref:WD repeat-containing protein 87-like isoform X2 n=1 Tax=Siniperca chuatsi TaxID=119488 RepID=UPI001CE0CD18|nr:WD repeat-containing protein 87-like isoform X2 [Siniperca chuatsi]